MSKEGFYLTNSKKCIVIIACDEERYVDYDNSLHKTMTKEIDFKYIQIIENLLHTLESMSNVDVN